ncbi:hypothetical protein AB4Y38_32780 [Paraburkholderia sp. EG285A]|uniref:hypothetical protein n=1 Tax=Paraburkholderia sp. EG285A TaxID=3237009 RepID=UPI0034D1D13D
MLHTPVATSFKHLSPAGIATAGDTAAFLQNTWGLSALSSNSLLSAYVRARDADPKSSFGDAIAVSEPLDDAGVHTRTSVGVLQLPKGASVEVDFAFRLRPV